MALLRPGQVWSTRAGWVLIEWMIGVPERVRCQPVYSPRILMGAGRPHWRHESDVPSSWVLCREAEQ